MVIIEPHEAAIKAKPLSRLSVIRSTVESPAASGQRVIESNMVMLNNKVANVRKS